MTLFTHPDKEHKKIWIRTEKVIFGLVFLQQKTTTTETPNFRDYMNVLQEDNKKENKNQRKILSFWFGCDILKERKKQKHKKV